jgi:hypothetical protein
VKHPWHPRTRGRTRRRRALVIVPVVCVAASMVGFGAAAYWTHNGNGSSTGHIGTMTAATLTLATEATALYPGGAADLTVTVANPNDFSVVLSGVAVDPGSAISSSDAGCDGPTYVSVVPGTLPTTVIAANSSEQFVLTDAARLSVSAVQACQGATFTIPLAVTVKR